jgi:hypothetical protein
MSVPRWRTQGRSLLADSQGKLVNYADHVAALAEAEQRVQREGWQAGFDYAWHRGMQAQRDEVTYAETDDAYEQGQRDEREACIAAVRNTPTDPRWNVLQVERAFIAAIRAREEKP